jgi:hypothetical protein
VCLVADSKVTPLIEMVCVGGGGGLVVSGGGGGGGGGPSSAAVASRTFGQPAFPGLRAVTGTVAAAASVDVAKSSSVDDVRSSSVVVARSFPSAPQQPRVLLLQLVLP